MQVYRNEKSVPKSGSRLSSSFNGTVVVAAAAAAVSAVLAAALAAVTTASFRTASNLWPINLLACALVLPQPLPPPCVIDVTSGLPKPDADTSTAAKATPAPAPAPRTSPVAPSSLVAIPILALLLLLAVGGVGVVSEALALLARRALAPAPFPAAAFEAMFTPVPPPPPPVAALFDEFRLFLTPVAELPPPSTDTPPLALPLLLLLLLLVLLLLVSYSLPVLRKKLSHFSDSWLITKGSTHPALRVLSSARSAGKPPCSSDTCGKEWACSARASCTAGRLVSALTTSASSLAYLLSSSLRCCCWCWWCCVAWPAEEEEEEASSPSPSSRRRHRAKPVQRAAGRSISTMGQPRVPSKCWIQMSSASGRVRNRSGSSWMARGRMPPPLAATSLADRTSIITYCWGRINSEVVDSESRHTLSTTAPAVLATTAEAAALSVRLLLPVLLLLSTFEGFSRLLTRSCGDNMMHWRAACNAKDLSNSFTFRE
mmetsp:Transcript_32701/g.55134  ORF Transcript_32701/g.55134 Transcript_32701/m.55134 type:complete len:486 (+) Transcript_32701:76-1533(+)